jgi:hypothetical protein
MAAMIEYSIGPLREIQKSRSLSDVNKSKQYFMSPSGSGLLTIRVQNRFSNMTQNN